MADSAVFGRVDGFLERCHDVMELTQTVLQFGKLGRTEIGGTKGRTLTSSVNQVHADFMQAVEVRTQCTAQYSIAGGREELH